MSHCEHCRGPIINTKIRCGTCYRPICKKKCRHDQKKSIEKDNVSEPKDFKMVNFILDQMRINMSSDQPDPDLIKLQFESLELAIQTDIRTEQIRFLMNSPMLRNNPNLLMEELLKLI